MEAGDTWFGEKVDVEIMKKFVVAIFVVIILATLVGYGSWRLFLVKPAPEAGGALFKIEEGQNLTEIAKSLKDGGFLKNDWLFKWYLHRRGLDTKIQSGIFELKPNLNVAALARILTSAELAERKLIFIEGWNLRDIGHYLEYQGMFMAEELHELVGFPTVDYRLNKEMPALKDFSADFDFLKDKPRYAGLEGYLFPDTYRVKKQATVEEIVRRLLGNFGRKLTPELRDEIRRQDKTIFEIVTMASLLEAEAKEEKDRRLIADILWRRLAIGMPLQVDSSVNYATGNKKPAISLAEQTIESPYNTYKYPGLPLGPINNPSLSSILAAIYPEKNDDWFFLSDKEGKMHYAKDLKEQEENKERYLR